MKTYYAGGTVGDAYIILCKLYSVAMKEPILCKHYTAHKSVKSVIKEIYGLVPSIKVEFVDKSFSGVALSGAFENLIAEKVTYGTEPEYYPEFKLESVKQFDLPETYVVLQTVSGIRRDRKMFVGTIQSVLTNAKLPVVLIGEVDERVNWSNDVRRQTSIKQDINIIRNSKHFYGLQGFLSYVAVSQKVPSTVFIETRSDEGAIQARTEAVEQWRKYLTKR